MSNFCQQGDITKIFIVDTGNSGTTTVDVYVTGGTYSNGTLYLTRNDGVTIPVPGFLFTGNTSASCIGNLYISNLYACNVPQESGGGGGGDPDDPFPPPSPVVITPPPIILVWDPIKSFSPISATTFFGDGSKLTGIPDFYVTGGTINTTTGVLTLNRQNGFVEVTGFTFTGGGSLSADTFVTGYTFTNGNILTIFQNNGKNPLPVIIDNLFLTGLTVNGSISASTYLNLPQFVTGGTFSAGTLTLNTNYGNPINITGITSTNITTGISADTFVTGFTFTSENTLTIFQNQGRDPLSVTINNLTLTGLTVSGSLSASTYLGLPISSDNFVTGGTFSNNILTLNRQNGSVTVTGFTDYFVTGGTYSNGTLTLNRQNGSVTVTGFLTGTTTDTFVTGFTYNGINQLTLTQNQGQLPLNIIINNLILTGLTVNGSLSASTYLGLPISSDNFVTGGTFSNNILTLNRQNGSVTVTGFTDNFVTGGTYSNGTLILNRQNGSVSVGGFLTGTTIDTFVTGFTFSSNTLTISQNQGQAPLTANITTIDLSNIFSAVTFNIGTTGSISASTFYGSGTNLTGVPDNFVTGGTYSNGTLTLNRQNGSVSVSGFLTGTTTDTFVTGFTYSNNNLTITRNQGQSPLVVTINNFTGLTINGSLSASTYLGLPVSSDNFVTGGTYSNGVLTLNRQNGSVTISGLLSADTYVTGFTFNAGTYDLTIFQNNGIAPLTENLGILAGDITVTGGTYNPNNGVATFFNNAGGSFQVSGFLTGFTDIYLSSGFYNPNTGNLTLTRTDNVNITVTGFTDYYVTGGTYSNGNLTLNRQNGSVTISGFLTGTTTDTFVTGFTYNGTNQLTISQNQGQPNLNVIIDNLSLTGLTVNGSISATTYFGNGQYLTGTPDNYVTGGTYSSGTGTLTLNRQNGSVTISGFSAGGGSLSADTYVTGFTYNGTNQLTISQNGSQPNLSVTINNLTLTGLTVNGSVSATTYFGNGQFLTGIASTDNFVTGGTYTSSTGTLTLNRQNGSVTVTGFTDTFVTGGTFNTSNRVLTLNRQNGSFNISGITDTFVTGFTYSSNNLTINQSQGQTPLTVNISTMTGLTINGDLSTTNITVTSTSNLNGTINSTNLAGTGDRVVQVSSGGTFSAPSTNLIITAYLVSGSTNANILETTSNWDINGVFVGSGITGTYQGQKFYNNNYFFEAVDNDLWIRLIRG